VEADETSGERVDHNRGEDEDCSGHQTHGDDQRVARHVLGADQAIVEGIETAMEHCNYKDTSARCDEKRVKINDIAVTTITKTTIAAHGVLPG
jgi:hypothetical protein